MLEKAKDNLRKYVAGKRAAAFVSGGPDSMCLLSLCAGAGLDFFVVTVNHGIRPESADEVRLVQSECARQGIPCEVYAADVPALARASGDSLETAGRLFRRRIMAELTAAGRADVILTAHHADDNAETVLMHILRGSGLNGLIGMRVCDGPVVRPLIETTRAEIESYIRAHDIPFATDESNADSRYTRNFIRNEVLPLLNSRFDASAALNRLSRHAAADEAYMQAQMRDEYLAVRDGEVTLLNGAFDAPALAPRYVLRALTLLGANAYDLTAIERTIALFNAQTGKRAPLPGGITAVKDADGVTLCAAGKDETRADEAPFTGAGAYPAFGFVAESCPAVPAVGVQRFDLSAVPHGTTVRYRRAGDRFTPFGGGERKLKEFLIDKKIPVRIRDKLPLICYNEQVLIVCGVEIADSVRLTAGARAAQITFTGETLWKN